MAAYFAPSGQYADDSYGLGQDVTNGPLKARAAKTVGGNGVYYQGNGFPSGTGKASNYFVDVLFTPAVVTPYLQISLNPSNPSITSSTPLGSVIATITPSWSNAARFPGRFPLARPIPMTTRPSRVRGNNLIINTASPSVSADANRAQKLTVVPMR